MTIRVAEVLRVKLSLQFNVRILGLRPNSIVLAANFTFKDCQVFLHTGPVFLEIDARTRPGVSLSLRHAQSHIGCQLPSILIHLLLVGDLLKVNLLNREYLVLVSHLALGCVWGEEHAIKLPAHAALKIRLLAIVLCRRDPVFENRVVVRHRWETRLGVFRQFPCLLAYVRKR